MFGELGNETYIDILLEYSALSTPNFTLIRSDDFIRIKCGKVGSFEFFAVISARSSLGRKSPFNFHVPGTFFLLVLCVSNVSGSALPNFSPNS